jgi:sugar phosphate isomerase/epimerase
MVQVSRRSLLQSAGIVAAGFTAQTCLPHLNAQPGSKMSLSNSPFKLGVISDEISQDFDHACSVIANDFGLHYVELRELWGKNLQVLPDADLSKAQTILAKYKLQVTDISSPLFKSDWPGAPKSKYGSTGDLHGATETNFHEQDKILARSIELAKRFNTNKVRCFDFWRLDDIVPFRAAINDKLHSAAELAGSHGVLLVLENEASCNTATGREAGKVFAAVQTPHFALNWDPGNAVMRGELDAFPGGWDALPKNRIHHCHCKNAQKNAAGKIEWAPVDVGYIDWTAQFRALKAAGYHDAVNLETHWTGGGTPEASSRTSWAGMKKCLEQAHVA